LVPRTSVTESGSSGPNSQGLWPTPVADGDRTTDYKQGGMSLGRAARMVPTPRASDGAGASSHGRTWSTTDFNLHNFVRQWPTPQSHDNRDRGNLSTPAIQRRAAKGKQLMLSMVVSDVSGQLNPTWVEWLMGFPTGWTDLGPSEMPSSRKSSKSSAGSSSKR
jgi:hypothetical protein